MINYTIMQSYLIEHPWRVHHSTFFQSEACEVLQLASAYCKKALSAEVRLGTKSSQCLLLIYTPAEPSDSILLENQRIFLLSTC